MSLYDYLIPSRSHGVATRDSGRAAGTVETVKPAYEIRETPDAFGVTVYLPGVAKDGLQITAEDGQLRVVGRRDWKQPEGWTTVHRESAEAPFELLLSHDNIIDGDKVAAELRDGVVRISLPKHEAVKPRKIAVK
jgi:HSP20 family molecular chaperone IbpA